MTRSYPDRSTPVKKPDSLGEMHRQAWLKAAAERYGDYRAGPSGDYSGSEAHWAAFAGDVPLLQGLEPGLLEATNNVGATPAHWANTRQPLRWLLFPRGKVFSKFKNTSRKLVF